jgi:hypothetical protein
VSIYIYLILTTVNYRRKMSFDDEKGFSGIRGACYQDRGILKAFWTDVPERGFDSAAPIPDAASRASWTGMRSAAS